MGKAMFTIIAAMAELERSVICERVTAGLNPWHQEWQACRTPVGHQNFAPRIKSDGCEER
jgi:hypothetical protein